MNNDQNEEDNTWGGEKLPPNRAIAMDYLVVFGLNPIPLVPRDKRPLVNWKEFQTKDVTSDLVRKWWGDWPDANIGVITGSISQLLVLDIDGEEGKESFRILSKGKIPDTPTVKTSRGKHFYFWTGGNDIDSMPSIYPGLDIKANGGYVVAPPSIHPSGRRYKWESTIYGNHLIEMPDWLWRIIDEKNEVMDTRDRGVIETGQRNTELTKISGTLRNRGLSPDMVKEALKVINQERCRDPLGEGEIGKITTNFSQNKISMTDIGNAERMILYFGDSIRFSPPLNRWLIWNGKIWRVDDRRDIYRIAIDTARTIHIESMKESDQNDKISLSKWAITSESSNRIDSMIKLAASFVPVSPDELDHNIWLLNVDNGIIDLRTGLFLQDHRKEEFITKMANVSFEPSSECPQWAKFLEEIFDGNEELVNYMQKAVGYSLTGDTREQVLFFLHGTGANGKTTFLEVIRDLMGDYSRQTDFSTFVIKKHDTGPRNDIARLKGARLVCSVEVEEGKQLAENLVKQLTGQDKIYARFLYSEGFEFAPNFKIWIAANNKPEIKGAENAIWRRIRLIPFAVTIPEEKQDRELAAKLKQEKAGILNWIIEGCLNWQREGLTPPSIVVEATEEYKGEMDPLKDFLDDLCKMGVLEKTLAGDLYEAYKEYCSFIKATPISQQAFGRRLSQIGLKKTRDGSNRYWEGIELIADQVERMRKSYRGSNW